MYDVTTSYLDYPSATAARELAILYNTTVEDIITNSLGVNIFYQSQNTEVHKTVDAYSGTALLSDIGGLLGLFLGMSVISMLEFGTWILDEIKDRCFGVNDKKLEEWYDEAEAAWDDSMKQESDTAKSVARVDSRIERVNDVNDRNAESIRNRTHDDVQGSVKE